MSKKQTFYWHINTSMSRNALFNFIVSSRGLGKTYGCKEFVIDRFLKDHSSQFGYIRRYKTEYDEAAATFFDDIRLNEKYKDVEFSHKGSKYGGTFYIDGEVAGHGFALSTSMKIKSASYPNIDFLLFDEFMLDPKSTTDRYLRNEIDAFLNLYETIARLRDVRVYFLSNALSWTNPYFLFFNVKMPYGKSKVRVVNDILVEIPEGKDYKEFKRKTRYGKIIDKTTMGKHIIDNEFVRDTKEFIHDPYEHMIYFFTLVAKGQEFGVYMCPDDGVMFVSDDADSNYKLRYTTILENHKVNTLLIKGSQSPPFKRLVDEFKRGNVRFKNQLSKNIMIESMKEAI